MTQEDAYKCAATLRTISSLCIVGGVLSSGAFATVNSTPAGFVVAGMILASSLVASALLRAVAAVLACLLRIECAVSRRS